MKIKKIIILQLLLIIVISIIACSKSDKSDKKNEEDNGQYEDIINMIFKDEDKNIKEYLNTLVVKDVGALELRDFKFSLDEIIFDSRTGIGAYKMNFKSDTVNLSELNADLTLESLYYVMENNNYSISFFDGFVPKDIFNHKYKKLPFRSYQVSRISDNEVIIYVALDVSEMENELMIQTNDRIKAEENLRKEDEGIEIEEDENALPYYGRIKLPQSDNSISINVTEDNTILEFYISPLGIRSRERGSDKESKLFNKNSYITMENGKKIKMKDFVQYGDNWQLDDSDSYEIYFAKKFININEIKSVTINGVEYSPE